MSLIWPELLNALAWMGIWRAHMLGSHPDLGTAITYSLVATVLVVMIFIDIEVYLVPDKISALILFLGLGYNVWLFAQSSSNAVTWGIPSSIAGALLGIGFAWGLAFLGRIIFGKDALGHGDIKLTRGIGAVLFPSMLTFSCSLALGLMIFVPIVLAFVPRKRREEQANTESRSGSVGEDAASENDQSNEPESIGSLLRFGMGYVLCFDVVGLFLPKFYQSYFGEEPHSTPTDLEDFASGTSLIPSSAFGGIAAILTMIFRGQ
jgi:hypothetical protein